MPHGWKILRVLIEIRENPGVSFTFEDILHSYSVAEAAPDRRLIHLVPRENFLFANPGIKEKDLPRNYIFVKITSMGKAPTRRDAAPTLPIGKDPLLLLCLVYYTMRNGC